jgi:hypothetical protein
VRQWHPAIERIRAYSATHGYADPESYFHCYIDADVHSNFHPHGDVHEYAYFNVYGNKYTDST